MMKSVKILLVILYINTDLQKHVMHGDKYSIVLTENGTNALYNLGKVLDFCTALYKIRQYLFYCQRKYLFYSSEIMYQTVILSLTVLCYWGSTINCASFIPIECIILPKS